jgi:hypothetical protein
MPEPPHQPRSRQQESIVEVGSRIMSEPSFRTKDDFSREATDIRGDGSANDGMKEAAHGIAAQDKHRAPFVSWYLSEPHLAAADGMRSHFSVPYRAS